LKLNKVIVIPILIVFALLCIAYPYRHRIKKIINVTIEYYSKRNHINKEACPDCQNIFIDNVKKHEKAYQKEGIKPQKNHRGLKKLLRLGKLKIVKPTEFYTVDNLHYSSPYLIPKALVFLRDLSKIYSNKCIKKTIPLVPFTISSLTRTTTDVKELMNNNKNAISNSSHLNGKTFDVNYKAFNQNKNQIKCFVAALSELRKKNRCFVKYECNGCLHITVN